MPKKSSERLRTVLKLAQLRQQQAAEQLGEMTRNAKALEHQADQLKHYQLDYIQHFRGLGREAISASQVRNFQHFYQNLEEVIDTQKERLLLMCKQQDVARERWQQQYAREKNLEKLVDRKAHEEQLAVEKVLQRQLDDRPRPISGEETRS